METRKYASDEGSVYGLISPMPAEKSKTPAYTKVAADKAKTAQKGLAPIRRRSEHFIFPFVQGKESLIQGSDSFVQGKEPLVQGKVPFVQGKASLVQGNGSFVQGKTSLVQREGSFVQANHTLKYAKTVKIHRFRPKRQSAGHLKVVYYLLTKKM